MEFSQPPTPKVSVIMPIYNSKKYLRESILSVIRQNMKDIEIILVDDHSTDGSMELILEFIEMDPRIKYHRNKKNEGIVHTRNVGFTLCDHRSKYYAIADSDDINSFDRIRKQYDFMEANPIVGLVGSNINIINDKNEITGSRYYETESYKIRQDLLKGNPIAHPTAMFRRSAIDRVGYYAKDGVFDRARDYDLIVKIGMMYEIANLDEKLVSYRIHNQQTKYTHLRETIKSTLEIQVKWIIKIGYRALSKNFFNVLMYMFILMLPKKIVLYAFKKIKFKGR